MNLSKLITELTDLGCAVTFEPQSSKAVEICVSRPEGRGRGIFHREVVVRRDEIYWGRKLAGENPNQEKCPLTCALDGVLFDLRK